MRHDDTPRDREDEPLTCEELIAIVVLLGGLFAAGFGFGAFVGYHAGKRGGG